MGKIYKQITSIALIREHRFVLGTYDTPYDPTSD